MIAHPFMCYDKITTVTDVVFVSRVAPLIRQDERGYPQKHFGRLGMQSKQEFVLNASRDALLALIASNEKVNHSPAGDRVTDDRLIDALIYRFGELYDKCAKIEQKTSSASSHDF